MTRLNLRQIWMRWAEACAEAAWCHRKFCVLHRPNENLFN